VVVAGDAVIVGDALPAGDGHVAGGVGATDDRARTLQRGEQWHVRLPVGVACAHADEHRAGSDSGEELR
jgi:hypothetical protein